MRHSKKVCLPLEDSDDHVICFLNCILDWWKVLLYNLNISTHHLTAAVGKMCFQRALEHIHTTSSLHFSLHFSLLFTLSQHSSDLLQTEFYFENALQNWYRPNLYFFYLRCQLSVSFNPLCNHSCQYSRSHTVIQELSLSCILYMIYFSQRTWHLWNSDLNDISVLQHRKYCLPGSRFMTEICVHCYTHCKKC